MRKFAYGGFAMDTFQENKGSVMNVITFTGAGLVSIASDPRLPKLFSVGKLGTPVSLGILEARLNVADATRSAGTVTLTCVLP